MKKTITVLVAILLMTGFASCLNNQNDNPVYNSSHMPQTMEDLADM